METRKIKRIVPALLEWFAQAARDLPWRKTSDPYAIWISEIMLQQTQVKTVIPYWGRWMQRLPTVQSFANARPEAVLKLWEGLGYYTRVRNAQKAAQLILDKHAGQFPHKHNDVLALPGIGRYTAGAICSIAFNQPEPILDGNVIRVLTRVFGVGGDPREKTVNGQLWELARQLVLIAAPNCSHFNQSLMELGALICTPRQPKCDECPAQKLCFAHRENRIEQFPALAPRVAATQRRFIAFVVNRKNRVLVRQRPEGVVNAHLWEFPNMEIIPGQSEFDSEPFAIAETTPICRIQHSITRYRITLEAYRATLKGKQSGVWRTAEELKQLPFTSAHRKIAGLLQAF